MRFYFIFCVVREIVMNICNKGDSIFDNKNKNANRLEKTKFPVLSSQACSLNRLIYCLSKGCVLRKYFSHYRSGTNRSAWSQRQLITHFRKDEVADLRPKKNRETFNRTWKKHKQPKIRLLLTKCISPLFSVNDFCLVVPLFILFSVYWPQWHSFISLSFL